MEAIHAWNPSWELFPWKKFTPPAERFEVLPTFVVGEFVYISLAALLLLHAIKQGRCHVMIWIASIVAGTANDAFFMALPIVDNFWQAQACIMLTPRMPLYIPCVYVVFMYTSAVGAWRVGNGSNGLRAWSVGALGTAALAGLMGELIYSPYDITGAKFLWWTWHDTDAPIRDRLFGAPVGSSCWVFTFSASFQWLLHSTLPVDVRHGGGAEPSVGRMLRCITLTGLLSTPIMMIQMSFFQLISGDLQGLPTAKGTMIAVITTYILLVFVNNVLLRDDGRNKDSKDILQPRCKTMDKVIGMAMVLYFVYLLLNMVYGVPEDHVSTGVHQTVGPCDVMDKDISGHERQVYLCRESYNEDFSFDCGVSQNLTEGIQREWYTVCGREHSDYQSFVGIIAALASVAIPTYSYSYIL